MEPTILRQTSEWIVIDKPSGWLSIPGRGQVDVPVVSEWLEKQFGKVWTVHRIDRETSGVLLFAKTAEAHRLANGWFSAHEVKKHYDFLAQGLPSRPALKLNQPIEGVSSLTQVEIISRGKSSFLGRARIITGRRHQIRIHLSQAGHPLLGDVRYGGPAMVARVALHAARLELPDGVMVEAPWPPDFSSWVAKIKSGEEIIR